MRKKKRLLPRVCLVLALEMFTGHRIGSDLSCFNGKSRHPRLSGRVVYDGGGEANSHSDLDFLVVEPEVDNEAEESVRLHRTLRDLLVPAV